MGAIARMRRSEVRAGSGSDQVSNRKAGWIMHAGIDIARLYRLVAAQSGSAAIRRLGPLT